MAVMSQIQRGRRLPFVVLPWAVLEHRSLTATDVLVYATIARFADNATGEAWPSRQTIAGSPAAPSTPSTAPSPS